MIERPISRTLQGISSAGNPVYRFDIGKQFKAILVEYGLIGNKHILLSLLTADVEVRRNLLAGICSQW